MTNKEVLPFKLLYVCLGKLLRIKVFSAAYILGRLFFCAANTGEAFSVLICG